MVNQKILKNYLKYDPKTGVFTWKKVKGYRRKVGEIAGCINKGYIIIGINGRIYRAHQLVFLYMKGYIPKLIDHIDRNGLNNKWNNLREANKSTNGANRKFKINNTSGFIGVSKRTDPNRFKRWRACIRKNGKQYFIGTYYTKIEAAKAYDKEVVKVFKKFAVTNKSLGLY